MPDGCLSAPATPEMTSPDTRPAEADLIERARTDTDAFAALYRMHYASIAGYIHRRTGRTAVTEDLVSEVFMKALKRISKFQRRGLLFRAWLYRIATNEVNQWARSERRRLNRERAHAGRSTPSDTTPAGTDAQRGEVRRALLTLAPKHQEVLALHHVESLGVEQIARILRRPVGTIKSRLLRARNALREALPERENHA